MSQLKKDLILWIKKQVQLAGAKGIVIGLSGGLDSSLVAALAVNAVGKKRVLGLILPCHTPKRDVKDVRALSRKLGIHTKFIDLSPVFDQLIKILPPTRDKVTLGNLKPRLRMVLLYYFANKLHYLVAGTGNKSEISIGYFTKYGDGGADILPLGNLYKTEVKKLAEKTGIPTKIINKTPTAGLWAGQTDEGELGITYERLDKILLCLLEKHKKVNLSRSELNRVKNLIKQSKHKRELPKKGPIAQWISRLKCPHSSVG